MKKKTYELNSTHRIVWPFSVNARQAIVVFHHLAFVLSDLREGQKSEKKVEEVKIDNGKPRQITDCDEELKSPSILTHSSSFFYVSIVPRRDSM
jgi:hypothetical protein